MCVKYSRLAEGHTSSAIDSHTAVEKLRIVALVVWHGAAATGPERWTKPKRSRRTCAPGTGYTPVDGNRRATSDSQHVLAACVSQSAARAVVMPVAQQQLLQQRRAEVELLLRLDVSSPAARALARDQVSSVTSSA
jgi:carbonic anhydrase